MFIALTTGCYYCLGFVLSFKHSQFMWNQQFTALLISVSSACDGLILCSIQFQRFAQNVFFTFCFHLRQGWVPVGQTNIQFLQLFDFSFFFFEIRITLIGRWPDSTFAWFRCKKHLYNTQRVHLDVSVKPRFLSFNNLNVMQALQFLVQTFET